MMGCKSFSKLQIGEMLKFIYRKLRGNQSKANQDKMRRRGKEEASWRGNQDMFMNISSPTLKKKKKKKGKTNEKEEEEEEAAMSIWDCGSPLYDSYELVSLDHIIDRNLMAFPSSSSSYESSKHINNTRFTHHSHDLVSHKVGSPEKSKGSFVVTTSLSKFSMKMMRNNNEEIRGKKNNEMRRGFDGFLVDLLYLWRK